MKICSFCGSDEKVVFSGKGNALLCHKHYMQMYHKGILTENFRNSLNEIIIFEDHAEIIALNRSKEEKGRIIIDLIDVEKCSSIKWGISSDNYCTAKIKEKTILIHRFLLDLDDTNLLVPDHKDGNKLNNRRNNLRIATYSQNNMNAGIRSNNTSGYNGISKTEEGYWHTYIAINGKRINLGWFEDINDAIKARKDAEEKYYGEYSYDNSRTKR